MAAWILRLQYLWIAWLALSEAMDEPGRKAHRSVTSARPLVGLLMRSRHGKYRRGR